MLSGGQRKRVGLAQVLIRDPKILLMDEPFGPLDAQTRQIMGNLLLDLWSADRKAVLFVTHDLEEAIALSDRVVIMSAGPAARIIGDWRVPLARPRDIGEIKLDHAFHDLHRDIWHMLKAEVIKGYAQTEEADASRIGNFVALALLAITTAKKQPGRTAMLRIRQTLAIAAGVLLLAGTRLRGRAVHADVVDLQGRQPMLPKKIAATTRPIRIASAKTCRRSCPGPTCRPEPRASRWSMIDPEGRAALGVDHWVAYGIPASVTGFAEGETGTKPSDKYVGGNGTAQG